MPLRATVNGQEIVSRLLSLDEWNSLKKRKHKEVILPCGCKGNLRTSKLGLQHFYHHRRSTDCDWENEGFEHLLAKAEIAQVCERLGFLTQTEAVGSDWRADVLATRQGTKKLVQIAFEVQWSPQTLEVTKERQAKYERDGVRTCWLFRKLPTLDRSYNLPMFALSLESDNRLMVEIEQQLMPIDLFIDSLLSGKIKFCQYYASIPINTTRIYFPVVNCSNCGSPYHYYVVQRRPVSCCGTRFDQSWPETPDVELEPEIQRVVKEYKNSSQGRNLYLGTIKLREQFLASGPTSLAIAEPSAGMSPMRQWQSQSQKLINQWHQTKVSTLTFGCPWCDAVLPNSLFGSNLHSAIYLDIDAEIAVPRYKIKDGNHWCYSKQRIFCEP